MINALLGILAAVGALLMVLIKKNRKLESDKKLSDIAVADAKLETQSSALNHQKDSLKEELSKLDKALPEEVSDGDIEKFWEKRK